MITLLEPPRPPGLPSGGFRYQERVVAALGDDASRISVTPAELRDKVLELRRQDPSAQIIVDGWFADLAADSLPEEVTALLHMVPARPSWSTRPLHVVATGQPTADAVAEQAASVTVVRPGVDACFSASPRSGDPASSGRPATWSPSRSVSGPRRWRPHSPTPRGRGTAT